MSSNQKNRTRLLPVHGTQRPAGCDEVGVADDISRGEVQELHQVKVGGKGLQHRELHHSPSVSNIHLRIPCQPQPRLQFLSMFSSVQFKMVSMLFTKKIDNKKCMLFTPHTNSWCWIIAPSLTAKSFGGAENKSSTQNLSVNHDGYIIIMGTWSA